MFSVSTCSTAHIRFRAERSDHPGATRRRPHAWSVGALVGVLLFKGIAYTLCLGSLRTRRHTGHGGGHDGSETVPVIVLAAVVQRGARSSASSSVVAAMMRERWVNAWGKLPSCSPLGPISSANRPTWFAYVCIFSKV